MPRQGISLKQRNREEVISKLTVSLMKLKGKPFTEDLRSASAKAVSAIGRHNLNRLAIICENPDAPESVAKLAGSELGKRSRLDMAWKVFCKCPSPAVAKEVLLAIEDRVMVGQLADLMADERLSNARRKWAGEAVDRIARGGPYGNASAINKLVASLE